MAFIPLTHLLFLSILISFVGCALSLDSTSTYSQPLNITAIASRNGYSVLECWQLTSVPFTAKSAINYVIAKNTTQAVWSVIEPQTTIGEAWAPTVQLTVILNGLIRITSPSPSNYNDTQLPKVVTNVTVPSESVAYIMPGTLSSSVLIAADLKSTSYLRGHFTEFPSAESTVLLQVPFLNNTVPEHLVIGEGPCH